MVPFKLSAKKGPPEGISSEPASSALFWSLFPLGTVDSTLSLLPLHRFLPLFPSGEEVVIFRSYGAYGMFTPTPPPSPFLASIFRCKIGLVGVLKCKSDRENKI
jgi:hypothetical protein